jgi:hypothetical protein
VKKYKQFMIGFLVGAMLFSSIGVFAEGITVLLNPYPIFFNGQAVQVESYNINGRTHVSAGDMANLFDATATINEVTKTIEINTNVKEFSTMNITTDLSQWIAPRGFAREGVKITLGDPIVLERGSIEIKIPESKLPQANEIKIVEVDNKTITIQSYKGITYFLREDLEALGLLP